MFTQRIRIKIKKKNFFKIAHSKMDLDSFKVDADNISGNK